VQVTDVVLNVILFFPLGTGLALLGLRRLGAIIIGALASAGIEGCQLLLITGRDGSVLDVVSNTAGTALGAILVSVWATRGVWWGPIGPVISALGLAAWIAGGLLIQPSRPKLGPWYSQWAHDFGGTVLYPGRVLSFKLNGIAVPDGMIGDLGEIQAVMAREGTTRVEAQIVTGEKFAGLAQLVGIMAGENEELVSVWQEGRFLKARHRLRSTEAGLRTPWFSVPAGLLEAAGDTVAIYFEMFQNAVRFDAVRGTERAKAVVPLAPELFWTGFVPFDYEVGEGAPWLPLFAAGLLFLAIGLGIVRHPRLGAGASLAALFVAPLVAGTPHPGAAASAIAVFCIAVGVAIGRPLGLGSPPA
jgi:hypothetical protein